MTFAIFEDSARAASNLRDGILSRVQAMPYFADYNFAIHDAEQIQVESIPFCGIYFIQQVDTPDLEPQTGETRFRTSVRIGFNIIILYSDGDAAETELDDAYAALCGLYSDPFFRKDDSTCKVQGFTSANRIHRFGTTGQNNETPIANLRLEMVCDLGTQTFPSPADDDLNLIHVKTVHPYPERDGTPDVIVEYDLEQN